MVIFHALKSTNRNNGAGGKGRSSGKKKSTPRRNILAWDRHWMRRSGRIRVPLWLHRVLVAYVRSGDGWGWILVALALLLLYPLPRVLFLMSQALTALLFSLPLYWILKFTIRRARPFTLFKSVLARVPPLDTYSFPSGHTMNNMAVAACLALNLPWFWPLAVAMPLALGLLRVLYGVHFLSDIVGGAVLGLAVAFASYALHAWAPGLFF
jgi:undecaprenyl-diphosphatase